MLLMIFFQFQNRKNVRILTVENGEIVHSKVEINMELMSIVELISSRLQLPVVYRQRKY